jgi:hypothetical protein
MAKAKYTYTFKKTGEVPSNDLRTGMSRSAAVANAKAASKKDGHSQDIFRRPLEDVEGHKVIEGEDGWQFVNTVGKKGTGVTHEISVVRECIRVIAGEMPSEKTAKEVRVMHFRRDGMLQAIQALQKHFGLED